MELFLSILDLIVIVLFSIAILMLNKQNIELKELNSSLISQNNRLWEVLRTYLKAKHEEETNKQE